MKRQKNVSNVERRAPRTHECRRGCKSIPPGPDWMDQLCGKCTDEIWEDWGRQIWEWEELCEPQLLTLD